jgi:excinuclease UvrABC ATPase subunit
VRPGRLTEHLADGQVAAEGVPDDVAKVQASFTGPFLKKVL